ncbi:hypothetical protein, partial [Bacillus altitudinis]|uniref:hypothetical protein n=1 Tax=Bacillus altitudinis TaxID=293387 RepID=UPI003D1A652D
EGRVLERSEFDIREHQRAGLTPNARVCLHAEPIWRHIGFLLCIKPIIFSPPPSYTCIDI